MDIAVLGWGSLIWCPGSLRVKTRWQDDGPMLPIEFARISKDSRLTLVIHSGSAKKRTYWALSEFATVDEARENLREREGNPKKEDIRRFDRSDPPGKDTPKTIIEWLTRHQGIQAVVWTALPSNWEEKRGCAFTPKDAVKFLSELEAGHDQAKATYDRAREYVTNAPPRLDTAVRKAMRTRGWKDAQLPTILFETPPAE